MNAELTNLEKIIEKEIAKNGPISFRDFMDMCLYYPGLGYYTSGAERIGLKGDYFTSPSLTPVFGEMIAMQISEMFQYITEPVFTIVEFGGGNGTLCKQIINAFNKFGKFGKEIKYFIIERKPGKIEVPASTDIKVEYISSILELQPFCGVVISNELLDNFPVHRMVKNDKLYEIFVDFKDGEFYELLVPVSSTLENSVKEFLPDLPEGLNFEWNADIGPWLQEISLSLHKGFVLTIDYGDYHHKLLGDYFTGGTLRCYYHHQRNQYPYFHIGNQDITAHVNFSMLASHAKKERFELTGFTSQAKFLLSMGMCSRIDETVNDSAPINHADLLRTFVLEMGNRFKVMILHKNVQEPHLRGLQFAEPAFT